MTPPRPDTAVLENVATIGGASTSMGSRERESALHAAVRLVAGHRLV